MLKLNTIIISIVLICFVLGVPIQAVDINIAQGKTVTASAQSGNNGPNYAVDGNVTNATYWDAGKVVVPQWLKIDLGGAASLSKIELYPVTSPDYASTRRNFQIQGSQDSSFTTYDVLGEQGNSDFGISNVFTISSFDNGKSYRYIRYIKTVSTESCTISELKIFGSITVNVKTNATANINGIALQFDNSVPGLTVDDLKLTQNGVPINIQSVTAMASSGIYNLGISNIMIGDEFVLNITKNGYVFDSDITFCATQIIDMAKNYTELSASATQTGYEFANAVDQDTTTFWNVGGVAGTYHYLQLKLPIASIFKRVELDGYKGTNQNIIDTKSYRQNFEIRASNDPTFATYTVLGEQGNETFDITKPWGVNISNTTPYQYIRFQKTTSTGVLISEFRAYVDSDSGAMIKSVQFANGTNVDGAKDIPIFGNEIIVSFSDDVDFGTVTKDNIVLEKTDSYSQISCDSNIDSTAKTFKLKINEKLDYQTNYKLTISNVESIYGMKIVTPISYGFVSVDMKYKIRFSNGTIEINSLLGQTQVKAKADIIKTAQDGENYILLLTLYNGDLMEKVLTKTVSLATNATHTVETDFLTLPANLDLSKYQIRAFIWDSISGMNSFSETLSINK